MALIQSFGAFDTDSFNFSALRRDFLGGVAQTDPEGGADAAILWYGGGDTSLSIIGATGTDLDFAFEGVFSGIGDNGFTSGNVSEILYMSWEIPEDLGPFDNIDDAFSAIEDFFGEFQTISITDFSFSGKALSDAAKTPSTADEQSILRTILSGDDRFELSEFADRAEGFGGKDTMMGMAGNDRLSGGSGRDRLEGGSGFDRLFGGSGADRLIGGGGNDRLTGGTGRDTLTGNSGADRFVFASAADAGKGSNRDVITDFSRSQGDRIDLKAIDARAGTTADDAFKFIGGRDFSNTAGELRYDRAAKLLQGDTNGDGQADFELHIDNGASLAAGDFIL
jgi:Ca2+-binding RTX toxin-like protein